MSTFQIQEVTPENAANESLFCIKDPNYPGFKLKVEWLKERIKEGLKLKLLKIADETVGFIEYVPGKFAWRPVSAENYLFIHCMWVFPTKTLAKVMAPFYYPNVKRMQKRRDWMVLPPFPVRAPG